MSARARQRRRRAAGSIGKTALLALSLLVALLAIAAGGVALWVLDVTDSAPSIDTLKPADSGTNSEVFDAAGNSLGFVQSEILREPVRLKRAPEALRQATIAIEDETFYEHGGVDYSAIVRAAFENLEAGEVEQGGSTITQQLVRNLYIKDPEDTLERKIIEAELAREYEREHSKDEILEQYLNTASYGTNDGRTAVGVEAAAEVFFNKDVKELGPRESALLAGLPQAPTTYNPFLNPEVATERRNDVLDAMADQGYITEAKAAKLQRAGLGLERGYRYEQREQQFFFDYVQQELIDRYGTKRVRDGGLRVYTTLEPDLQAAAEAAIAAYPVTSAASALVSTDVDSGEILAMASSIGYDSSQFNLAAQGERQPGSSFKPFVLTTAVSQGIDPDRTTYSAPSTITLNPDPYTSWTVSGGGSGSVNLRQATTSSINTVYAQLGVDVGPESFAAMARRLGIESKLDGYYAEALGGTTKCCTVLEMSNAYATIAGGGVHHEPTAIRRVEFADGKADKPEVGKGRRVISDGVAYEVADVLEGTLDSGTASCCDIPCPAAGKTGTTEEQSDAWFIGFTPHVSTAVWTGNPNERVPLPGYGADLSAPIWQDYMLTAAAQPCEGFPQPKQPARLTGYSSGYAGSAEDSSEEADPADADAPPADTGAAPPPADADGDGYDDSLYAPGVEGDGGSKKQGR